VGLCYAAHLFSRGCARVGTALVLSSSDRGDVACAAVEGACA
jgi:hypothetical protein